MCCEPLSTLFLLFPQLHNCRQYNEASTHNNAVKLFFCSVNIDLTHNNLLCNETSMMKQLLKTEGLVGDWETHSFLCLVILLLSETGHLKCSKVCFFVFVFFVRMWKKKKVGRASEWKVFYWITKALRCQSPSVTEVNLIFLLLPCPTKAHQAVWKRRHQSIAGKRKKKNPTKC